MKKYKRKLNDESGVTLVELLAAITILSIIVTAFLAFFIQAANTNQRTNKINEATFLAQEKIEEITSGGPTKEGGYPDGPKNSYWIATEVDESEDPNLYKVIVTVRESKSEGSKTHAKMETRLPVKDGDETE